MADRRLGVMESDIVDCSKVYAQARGFEVRNQDVGNESQMVRDGSSLLVGGECREWLLCK
jgi:hypothetical protein